MKMNFYVSNPTAKCFAVRINFRSRDRIPVSVSHMSVLTEMSTIDLVRPNSSGFAAGVPY